jgi:hypothetical protein
MSGVPMMNNMTTLKYWSWIGVFRVDSLLVSASLAGLPLNCKTSLRRGFLFYTHFDHSKIYQFGLLSKRYDIFVLSLITALMIVRVSL